MMLLKNILQASRNYRIVHFFALSYKLCKHRYCLSLVTVH